MLHNVLGLLNTDLHSATNEFINVLFSHFLYPLISRPTRLTSYSATLIDNNFTNNISTSCDNGLVINDLSDHVPIFTLCYSEVHSSTIKSKESVAIPNFSSQNINAFNNLLCEFVWNSLIYADENAAYNGFLQKCTEFYNKSFPIKFCQGKNLKTLHNPWLTTGILKSIKTKSRLYKLFLRKPSHERESNYKSFRNKLSCLVHVARKNYYDNKLDKARSNLKRTWKILNELNNRHVTKSPYPASFTKNGMEISNPTDIANNFCDYFTNKGPNLVSKIP